jgi:type VI protein secretion system component Hcp
MRITALVSALILAVCTPAVDAGGPQTTAIMKISGIAGEITIRAHETDWSQIPGMPDPTASSAGRSGDPLTSRSGGPLASRGGTLGGRGGSVAMQDVSIVKDVDRASPNLAAKCSSGEHISEVKIEFPPSAQGSQEYLVVTMTNVVIDNISPQSSTGVDRPTESVTLAFETIGWEYRPAQTGQRPTQPYYSFTPSSH